MSCCRDRTQQESRESAGPKGKPVHNVKHRTLMLRQALSLGLLPKGPGFLIGVRYGGHHCAGTLLIRPRDVRGPREPKFPRLTLISMGKDAQTRCSCAVIGTFVLHCTFSDVRMSPKLMQAQLLPPSPPPPFLFPPTFFHLLLSIPPEVLPFRVGEGRSISVSAERSGASQAPHCKLGVPHSCNAMS